ncbi:hypothetical protein D9619_008943 [Psilocybe cf. subviscida]|uniref:EF-hand domain-containing protein n=1 Tax=Psilocybe cf. subviscida TaxID=2480587 RepID=A0A8H5FAX8_9AGAR|nr:hypothetical protein D9619_008943 [Psilocybe cf. subviscida]
MEISISVPDLSDDESPVPSKHAAPPADTAEDQEEVWSGLKKFYDENAESIDRSRNLDLKKGEKDADFQIAMDTFVETTKVVLDGLTALANVHPVLGVAIFAFHGVITLDLTRRENDRKVLAVKLQMQSMMCSMFQLCKLTHAHVEGDDEKKAQKAQLGTLVKTIADDITQCGSDFKHYSNRQLISKVIKAKAYQRRFADHIEKFTQRRSDLQLAISAYTAAGMDAANAVLAEVKKTTDATDSKVDSILVILQRLESPHVREVLKFIDEHGGPETCISKDDLLSTLANKTGQSAEINTARKNLPQEGQEVKENPDSVPKNNLKTLRKSLQQELKENLDAVLKNNLQRFEKLLKVQNRNLERMSDQIAQVSMSVNDHDMKLDTLLRTYVLIYEQGKIIKKAVAPTAPIKLKDPELQRIWSDMGLRRSVKAKQFVLTFRDYLITSDQTASNTPHMQSTVALPDNSGARVEAARSALFSAPLQVPPVSTLHPNGLDGSEEWVLKHIDVAHIQPIIEAMDEDGSGFISVREANKFALGRPPGMRLLHWIAYWASGWHYNVTDYRKKIYSIMIQMHRMASKVLLVNRKVVHMYLDNEFFFRLESILRSIKPLPESVVREPELIEIADKIAANEENRLRDNLKTMGYLVQSTEDVALIAGSGRLEIWLLPLLYLVLERHLEVFKLSQSTVLHMIELRTHTLALGAILDSYDERTARLKDIFQQLYKDTAAQFKNYAYGMFVGSYNWTGVMKPMENSLLLDNDALYFSDEDDEEPTANEQTSEAHGDATKQPGSEGSPTEQTADAGSEKGTRDTTTEPGQENKDISKGNTEETVKESRTEGKEAHDGLDHSILLKGLGPSLELPEIDPGPSDVPGHEAHYIEGTWVGTYETTTRRFPYPAFQYFITSVADGKLEATGRYFTVESESEGTFNAEENIIDFKLVDGNYPPRRVVGKFDADRNVVEGRWVSESTDGKLPSPYDVEESDDSHFCGAFKLTRHTPSAFRFRDLLKELPEQDPPMSIARRRWAFAIEAVRFDVQQRLGSWNFFRTRIEERNAWIELSIRDVLEIFFTSTVGFTSPEQDRQFHTLLHELHPSVLSVYEAMSLYLFDRFWYNVGVNTCDSCTQRIPFRRYTCITCVEEDFSNVIDFCVEDRCFNTLTEFDRRDFVHSFSHTLIRSTQRLLAYEMPFLFTMSRQRSERVKRSFREQEVAKVGVKPNVQKVVSIAATQANLAGKPSVTALVCCICNQDLTLPCWACASCDVDLLFCVDCEKLKRPLSRKTKHSRDHPMLRITDSVDAKVIRLNTNNKNMEDMETRINERNNIGLERLEAKVLNETEARMADLETKITGQITSLESKVEVLLQLLQSIASNGTGRKD